MIQHIIALCLLMVTGMFTVKYVEAFILFAFGKEMHKRPSNTLFVITAFCWAILFTYLLA